jgi:hypothetical protein
VPSSDPSSACLSRPVSPEPGTSAIPIKTPEDEDHSLPQVFVKVAKAYLMSPSGAGTYVNVFIDEGSKRSYIRGDLARSLGLPIP